MMGSIKNLYCDRYFRFVQAQGLRRSTNEDRAIRFTPLDTVLDGPHDIDRMRIGRLREIQRILRKSLKEMSGAGGDDLPSPIDQGATYRIALGEAPKFGDASILYLECPGCDGPAQSEYRCLTSWEPYWLADSSYNGDADHSEHARMLIARRRAFARFLLRWVRGFTRSLLCLVDDLISSVLRHIGALGHFHEFLMRQKPWYLLHGAHPPRTLPLTLSRYFLPGALPT